MDKLLDALPARYANCGQITRLLRTLRLELDHLEQQVQAAAARGLISQADEAGLRRWEDDLGLTHRPDLTLEGRRAILHAALDRAHCGTAEALAAYAEALTGTAGAQVAQDHAAFALTLTTEESNLVDFYSLQHWVGRRLPAHVTGTFVRTAAAAEENTVENGCKTDQYVL